ncbi:hypothetical protein THASP1DRAFT_28496 [Thamnocephalis sphaerospora]|uniref:Uncharacterized protein n=1 Tax=Thamnocephalis sphaerospora TaxID=78915 RepID=A0A4P9XU59_9FUNG|nr:hypothetical protein THASP1DRAFT_28496 [Thamnocephalis sphaerospora]|eukprot:RKP09726.1 hypothetical protein THASP1DRAFT_28496 [Thamnocephalis sphaerospora]
MRLASRAQVLATLDPNWRQNATWFGNIPLHPLGEQSFLEFFERTDGSLFDIRERNQAVFRHFIIITVAMIVFVPNLAKSLRLVRARPRTMAPICCLLQSIAGIMCVVATMASVFPGGPSCRMLSWISNSAGRISDVCVSAVLLQKAYLVHRRSRWLLAFIPVIVATPIVLLYFSWASPTIMTPYTGCVFIYDDAYPWMRFGFHAPMNIALTSIFLIVAVRHYRQFGSGAWHRLTRDGILIGLALLLSSLLCTMLITFEVMGVFSILLTSVDWYISSLLLLAHVKGSRKHTSNASVDVKSKHASPPYRELNDSGLHPGPLLPRVAASITALNRMPASPSHENSAAYML